MEKKKSCWLTAIYGAGVGKIRIIVVAFDFCLFVCFNRTETRRQLRPERRRLAWEGGVNPGSQSPIDGPVMAGKNPPGGS